MSTLPVVDMVVPLTWLISAFGALLMNLMAGLILGARLMFRQEAMAEELQLIGKTLTEMARFETKLAVMEERLSTVQHDLRKHIVEGPSK